MLPSWPPRKMRNQDHVRDIPSRKYQLACQGLGDPHLDGPPSGQSSQKVRCCDCRKMDTWMKTHLREAPAKAASPSRGPQAHSPLFIL